MAHRIGHLVCARSQSSMHFHMASPLSNRRDYSSTALLRRVVITGLGLVTPLGVGTGVNWQRLLEGKAAVTKLSKFPEELPVKIGACVPRGSEKGSFDANSLKIDGRQPLYIQFALAAAAEALSDANFLPALDAPARDRAGVAIGSGIGGFGECVEGYANFLSNGYRKVSPFYIPHILVNSAAGAVSIKFQLRGPNHSSASACTTGAHSIGDASRFIRFGDADVMLAGGTEAAIHPMSIAGFARAKALASKYNDTPELASRPFDVSRCGFVMGEGAGMLVLEELEHARKRGANIYGEVRGYGLSGDAHHITSPPLDGNGAARCMQAALGNAGLRPDQVQYINAHATSTPAGDEAEALAIKTVFGRHASSLLISSTKGAVGHLLGAAGSVEAIYTILTIKHGVVPPTLNLDQADPACANLNLVPKKPITAKVQNALSNSFGFGGTNASLLFSAFTET